MQPKYEIIIRPPNIPAPRVLECDGPSGDTSVNYSTGIMLPTMSFEQFKTLPAHAKNPRYTHPSNQDAAAAARIGRLLSHCYETRNMALGHLLEIMTRFELLYPGSVEECRKINLSA
jgi:hypothetical protein